MMNRYCIVLELEEKFVKNFKDLHKDPWPEVLKALKENGCDEIIIWSHKNSVIVFYESEDLDETYRKLDKNEIFQKWGALEGPWIKEGVSKDKEGKFITLEKIFDLKQQISGELTQF
jgi:L-rhamnose mutarotase